MEKGKGENYFFKIIFRLLFLLRICLFVFWLVRSICGRVVVVWRFYLLLVFRIGICLWFAGV